MERLSYLRSIMETRTSFLRQWKHAHSLQKPTLTLKHRKKEMKSILKKIPSDLITFEDIINEQIKLMQNSTEEYDKFLKLLDDLITRIDLTMDSTRLTVIKKTVCFAEHNKVFLIPPRESSPRNCLTNPFPDLFD